MHLFFADTTDSGIAAIAVALIKPIVVIAAFSFIPASFKMAGMAMGSLHGLISSQSLKAKGFIKDTDMYKEGKAMRKDRQASMMRRLSQTEGVKSLTHSQSISRRAVGKGFLGAAGLALAGAPGSTLAIQRGYNKAFKANTKEMGDFDTISPMQFATAILAGAGDREAIAKTMNEAPMLMRYTKTLAGVQALSKQAGGFYGAEHKAAIERRFGANTAMAVTAVTFKDTFKSQPDLFMADEKKLGGYMQNVQASTIREDLGPKFFDTATGEKVELDDGRVEWKPNADSLWRTRAVRDNLSVSELGKLFDGRQVASVAKRTQIMRWAAVNRTTLEESENGRAILDTLADQMYHKQSEELFGNIYKEVIHTETPERKSAMRGDVLRVLGRAGRIPKISKKKDD